MYRRYRPNRFHNDNKKSSTLEKCSVEPDEAELLKDNKKTGASGPINSTQQTGANSKRPILPNFPYSPLTTPQVSPERHLRPAVAGGNSHVQTRIVTGGGGNSTSNSHSLSDVQQKSSVSVTEGNAGPTQLNQYSIQEQLGQGSYGLVQLAYNNEDSTYYALKILSKKKLMKSSGLFNRPPPKRRSTSSISSSGLRSPQQTVDPLHKIYKEIAIHKKLNHPNVVKLIEVLDDPAQDFLYMVFEYVQKGPVMQIGKDPPLGETKSRQYLVDTLLGLEYLHYQKIIHRDIKPANLLLSSSNQVKIADFGVSNEFSGDDIYLSTTAGSPAFMAPESVAVSETVFAGKALDIWALGITLFAFLFGKVPYEHYCRIRLYQLIINEPVIYPQESKVSEFAIDLLKAMLDKNPVTRIKLQDIKKHVWITDNGTKTLVSQEENCGIAVIDVTEEEVKYSINIIPRLETIIRVKMLLKKKSFRNPLRSNSVSLITESVSKTKNTLYPNAETTRDQSYMPIHTSLISIPNRSSKGTISPINEITDSNDDDRKME